MKKDIRVAINGFGRIGRSIVRAAKRMKIDIQMAEPTSNANANAEPFHHIVYDIITIFGIARTFVFLI